MTGTAKNMRTASLDTLQQDREALKQQLPAMLELLQRLVDTDSGSYDVEGVNAVGSILAARLANIGYQIKKRAVRQRGDLIVAQRDFSGHGRLLILGHLDTVWPKGTVSQWPFTLIDEQQATGPGIGDMKGGLVMALHVLELLAAQRFDTLASIKFVLVPDEELGSTGSRSLIEEEARGADCVLVLEPGRAGGGVVTARGALGVYFMRAIGCSAHCASNYRKGASALRELAFKVPALDGLSDPDQGKIINVGVFAGGTARQVVPGEASMDIDLRARTQVQADALHRAIHEIAAERRDPRVQITLEGGLTRPAFPAEKKNQWLISNLQHMADTLSVALFESPPVGGGSDGNFTASMGIPTLDGLGPVTHDICSRQETIDISSLVDRATLFCGLIKQLPQSIESKENQ